MIPTILQVALGGAIGASARYAVGVALLRAMGPGFPVATIAVNIVGSFLMGAFVVFAGSRGLTHLSPFVMTGILGGFTTFSAFSLEALTLWERGDVGQAAIYVGLSVVGSLLGLGAGLWMMRGILA